MKPSNKAPCSHPEGTEAPHGLPGRYVCSVHRAFVNALDYFGKDGADDPDTKLTRLVNMSRLGVWVMRHYPDIAGEFAQKQITGRLREVFPGAKEIER
jgi:hypothetical protein